MTVIRINHHPSCGQLAVFGLIWLVFFAALGGIVLHKTGAVPAAVAIWAAAVGVPLVGCVVPGFLRLVYVGMSYAAFPIGFVVSHVVLAVVYFLVLTPVALLMRLLGHDPMHRRFDPQAPTYWVPHQEDNDVNRYFRQF